MDGERVLSEEAGDVREEMGNELTYYGISRTGGVSVFAVAFSV
jgi:hypothetical protein